MNELPYNFDGHGSDVVTAIPCRQFQCTRQHLRLVRTARALLASITSQSLQSRNSDAIIRVIEHVKQIAKDLRFKVVVKKSTAMIADIGAAMTESLAHVGKRFELKQH